MERIDTLVVGAGQAGLATSYCLTRAGREHVILEKDRVAKAWRHGRWDSFTLVTPNWMLRLPGMAYDGDDPDGFLKRVRVVEYVLQFAHSFDPPVKKASKPLRSRSLLDQTGSSFAARQACTRPPTW